MKFLVVIAIIFVTGSNSLPTRLTEEQFLSSTNDEESKSVDIVSGYAQIRRQGRNFGAGEKVKLSSKPVTVKDPASLNPPTEAKKMTTTFDEEKAPVFNLKQMIEDEAEKLKNEVEVASLMAAHAAEQAAANIKAAADAAVQEGALAAAEVDKIIEDAVSSGISEAEQIVKSEIEDIKEAAVAEESTEKAEEKVEETTSEKPSNVEWSSDEQAPKEASTEQATEAAVEKAEDLVEEQKLQEEAEKIDEPVVEEVKSAEDSPKAEEVATTLAPAADSEDAKSEDDSDDSSRTPTTETAHPPRDLDLGSVQEV